MKNRLDQSEYMALQLMEIEEFRLSLSRRGGEKISFQEATMLWISNGCAEEFREGYSLIRSHKEPASA